jgi:hypothetical protein
MIFGTAGETPLAKGLATGGSSAVMLGVLIFLILFATKAFRQTSAA